MVARALFWAPASLLGLATIGAYGTAYYAIGVLLPVIETAEGWSAGTLSLGVAGRALGGGVIALTAGRLFDRRGSRTVQASGLVLGATLLVGASFAAEDRQFVACWA